MMGRWLLVFWCCTILTAGWASASFAGPETTAGQAGDYLIGPGDVLEIAVWKDDALTRTVVVLPDGTISFPLVGRMLVGGKSVSQLQEMMEGMISKYMPDPVLTVSIQQVNSLFVYVIGKVLKPGRFLLNSDINVLQVLSLAGGMNTFAKRDNIKIYREKGGETVILQFDYDAVTEKDMLAQNITLQRGDVVVVP